jgi:branched-chain amino acid aminotransferase
MLPVSTKKIWMDGELVAAAEAKVHVLNHTLHYGVGAFEGIRCYATEDGPAIFRLREHVRRLARSARIYRLPLPYTEEEIARAIVETQAANDIVPSYIRPIVYRSEPALGVKNIKGRVSLAIAAVPARKYLGEQSERGVRAKISPFRKPRSDALPSFAKADGNYLNSYLAGTDATLDGYDEAILLDPNGFVAEGTGENIFLVRDGTVYTPGMESNILLGITRDSVIRLARNLGHTVIERQISINELLSADEAFFSGTYAEVAPIREISHYELGDATPGPVTQEILATFTRIIRGQEPKYRDWLYPVRRVEAEAPRAPRPVAAAGGARSRR